MGTWKFDPYHTQVEFSAKHLGMMTVRGHFADEGAPAEKTASADDKDGPRPAAFRYLVVPQRVSQ